VIRIETRGSFQNTEKFLKRMSTGEIFRALTSYGIMGMDALSNATPTESGLTADSWTYEVVHTRGSWQIIWKNNNTVAGTPLVILLQFGHGTGTGGYVQGRDFINPAIKPVFDKIAEEVWRVVTTS
jgi:hypothetical protein